MLKVTLVTPEKKLVTNQEATDLLVPGYEGQLNILEGHADFMTILNTGALSFKAGEKERHFSVHWGYCEVSDDSVTILAEAAEDAANIDIERAEAAYSKAQEKLEEAGLTVADIEKYQSKLQRADLRITLARNYRENN